MEEPFSRRARRLGRRRVGHGGSKVYGPGWIVVERTLDFADETRDITIPKSYPIA